MKKVLIGAGHRHTLGEAGNAFEAETNGKKVRAILDLYDANGGTAHHGFELRTYTPDRGLGMFPGYLNHAPVSGFKSDWIPDLMVELHSEGVGDTGVAGAFVINPDWPNVGDIDHDIINHGGVFPRLLTERSGGKIKLRPALTYASYTASKAGLMSERQTGVAISLGARLGVFRDTARFKATTSRTIFEQGAHSNPAERAYMQTQEFLTVQANAFLDAVGLFFDAVSPGWKKPAPTYTDPLELPPEMFPLIATVEALKDVVPRAWAEGNAPRSGANIVVRSKVKIIGEVKNHKKQQWFLLEDGSRVRASSFTPAINVRKR